MTRRHFLSLARSTFYRTTQPPLLIRLHRTNSIVWRSLATTDHSNDIIPISNRNGLFNISPPLAPESLVMESLDAPVEMLRLAKQESELIKDPRDDVCAVIRLGDLFSVGIGPSSSHTVGPMKASNMWLAHLKDIDVLDRVTKVKAVLYGSLAATGRGHMTPQALLLGLECSDPETVDTTQITNRFNKLVSGSTLNFAGIKSISFDYARDLSWTVQPLPFHPNGIRLTAFDDQGDILSSELYYSIGGGFVVQEATVKADLVEQGGMAANVGKERKSWPFPYHDASSLELHANENGLTIAQVVWANETSVDASDAVDRQIKDIWKVMTSCIEEGIKSDELVLPGSLNLKRRARFLHDRFMQRSSTLASDTSVIPNLPKKLSTALPLMSGIDELSCYAIAVNEVNAAGGRVVTSPTNGAAGVIPAVLKYYCNHWPDANDEHVKEFLLTAAALGMIFKQRASISAAEGGCMAEVGVASSMAAGALTACMGGTVAQVLQATEMAMEHFLGLTCDPVDGLVQVPCIERNSFGAVKAVTAAQLALSGQGTAVVDLDTVIKAMRDTARDMHHHYKETSLGGLATYVRIPVSSPAC